MFREDRLDIPRVIDLACVADLHRRGGGVGHIPIRGTRIVNAGQADRQRKQKRGNQADSGRNHECLFGTVCHRKIRSK